MSAVSEQTSVSRIIEARIAVQAPVVPKSKAPEILTGYLFKKGGGNSALGARTWKRRFFRLDEAVLSYYADAGDTQALWHGYLLDSESELTIKPKVGKHNAREILEIFIGDKMITISAGGTPSEWSDTGVLAEWTQALLRHHCYFSDWEVAQQSGADPTLRSLPFQRDLHDEARQAGKAQEARAILKAAAAVSSGAVGSNHRTGAALELDRHRFGLPIEEAPRREDVSLLIHVCCGWLDMNAEEEAVWCHSHDSSTVAAVDLLKKGFEAGNASIPVGCEASTVIGMVVAWLSSLPERLISNEMASALSDCGEDVGRVQGLLEQMPVTPRHTLAFLCQHWQRATAPEQHGSARRTLPYGALVDPLYDAEVGIASLLPALDLMVDHAEELFFFGDDDPLFLQASPAQGFEERPETPVSLSRDHLYALCAESLTRDAREGDEAQPATGRGNKSQSSTGRANDARLERWQHKMRSRNRAQQILAHDLAKAYFSRLYGVQGVGSF